MRIENVLKIAAVVLIAFFLYKKVLPNIHGNHATASAASASHDSGGDCAGAAAAASSAWGDGIGRFVNPPYDLNAWGEFRSRVDREINRAESQCRAGTESCRQASAAMSELRTVVDDLDSAIRAGTAVPDDLVRRQESIDNDIDRARELQKEGK